MAHEWYDEIDVDECVIIKSDDLDDTSLDIQEMAEEAMSYDTMFFNDEIERDGILSPADISEIY